MKWMLVGIIVVSGAAADLFNTVGMRHHGTVREFTPGALAQFIQDVLRNAYILGAIGPLIVSFFALMSLLSIAPVSFAIPATASSFLFETILGKVILKESVHWRRWIGAMLIALGVSLLVLP